MANNKWVGSILGELVDAQESVDIDDLSPRMWEEGKVYRVDCPDCSATLTIFVTENNLEIVQSNHKI